MGRKVTAVDRKRKVCGPSPGFFLFAGKKGLKTKNKWLKYIFYIKYGKYIFPFNTKVLSKRKK